MDGISLLTITVLAVFVGFEVVSKVSSTLHTPLMSGANAIHGIILVGAIIVAGQAAHPWVLAVALLAVVLATANLVGGFVVTDRMLEMFRGRRGAADKPPGKASASGGTHAGGPSEIKAHEGKAPEGRGSVR
jgi:NAD(P) transhydrogenase subunit alpha